jgi:hypothetical protein
VKHAKGMYFFSVRNEDWGHWGTFFYVDYSVGVLYDNVESCSEIPYTRILPKAKKSTRRLTNSVHDDTQSFRR